MCNIDTIPRPLLQYRMVSRTQPGAWRWRSLLLLMSYSVMAVVTTTVLLSISRGYDSQGNDIHIERFRQQHLGKGMNQAHSRGPTGELDTAGEGGSTQREYSYLVAARGHVQEPPPAAQHPSSHLVQPLLPIINAEEGQLIRRHLFEDKLQSVTYTDLDINQAARPSVGEVWPMPQTVQQKTPVTAYRIILHKLRFQVLKNNCDVINKAITRFNASLKSLFGLALRGEKSDKKSQNSVIEGVDIIVKESCSKYPKLESIENYNMSIGDDKVRITAVEVWGALHGLETLLQLIHKNSLGQVVVKNTVIKDFPRFQHRGILLDTGRHFLNKSIIMKNLDAMAMNKMNVFHWHIVDDQSFPYESKAFPELSRQGAFRPSEIYKHRDIAEIVEHARLRGIRVIPEVDTPGHVHSWRGMSDILTPCKTHTGPIDPTNDSTYQQLVKLFQEIMKVFPDDSIHFGGDECSYYCWSENERIQNFMKNHSMGNNFKLLLNYYFTRLNSALVNSTVNVSNSIYWQEVFDEGVQLDPTSIVQIWKGSHAHSLAQTTRAGYRALLSSCWYLNYVTYGKDWPTYYLCEPTDYPGTLEEKKLVLGGEACMWGEYVDDSNLLSTLWPRAIAVAERLWSPAHVKNPTAAEPRFEEQRCRMIKRGITASPVNGPGGGCEL